MQTDSQVRADRMVQLLELKNSHLRDILMITREQAPAIAEEDMTELERLISLKQSKIEEIDRIDEEFVQCFELLKKQMGVKSMDQLPGTGIRGLERLKQLTSEVMKTLEAISGLEKKNTADTNAILKSVGARVKKINDGKRTQSAYKPMYDSNPYFIDKKK